jgi:hypothetical protein
LYCDDEIDEANMLKINEIKIYNSKFTEISDFCNNFENILNIKYPIYNSLPEKYAKCESARVILNHKDWFEVLIKFINLKGKLFLQRVLQMCYN